MLSKIKKKVGGGSDVSTIYGTPNRQARAGGWSFLKFTPNSSYAFKNTVSRGKLFPCRDAGRNYTSCSTNLRCVNYTNEACSRPTDVVQGQLGFFLLVQNTPNNRTKNLVMVSMMAILSGPTGPPRPPMFPTRKSSTEETEGGYRQKMSEAPMTYAAVYLWCTTVKSGQIQDSR